MQKSIVGDYRNFSLTPLDSATCGFGDYTHDNDLRNLTVCLTSREKVQEYQYLDINAIKCRYLCPSPTG